MARFALIRLAPIAVITAVLCAAVPGAVRAQGSASADSAQAALQAELDAMLRELHGDWGSADIFEGGRPPDLLVVSTSDVRGEVAPCG